MEKGIQTGTVLLVQSTQGCNSADLAMKQIPSDRNSGVADASRNEVCDGIAQA